MSAIAARRTEPIRDINTTPLIDVLLVLLIMLIITLPPTPNSLEFTLPRPGAGPIVDRTRNSVTVTPKDLILWNGDVVSEAQLAEALSRAVALRPEPELLLEPDGRASYGQSARVLRLVKLSGASNVGFSGAERYQTFGR